MGHTVAMRIQGRARVVAAPILVLLISLWAAGAAGAQSVSTTVGERFADGLDSRLAAQRVGEAARAVGYSSGWHTSGRSAADAWNDGIGAAVWGVFGHANAGLVQTDEQPPGASDQYIVAGHLGSTWPANVYAWSDYLPYLDVDSMKLALLGGCDSANEDPDLGSFLDQGRQLGVDSVVGFAGLVFYPASCTTCDYSGNWFWERFAVYARAGDTVSTALSKAVADLRAKEGDAGGWDAWRVGGAAASPGAVRLTPASDGEWLNAKPLGIDPFDPLALAVTGSRQVTVDGRSYTDYATVEGVSYRLDAAGDLAWLSAPASTQGEERLDEDAARDAALRFVEAHVGWFDRGAFGPAESAAVSRMAGERRQRFAWRLEQGGHAGPAAVVVEVDRRTGAVVDLAAARSDAGDGSFAVGREEAIAAARGAAGSAGAVTGAARDVWDRPRWTVTIDRGTSGRFRDVVRVVVDGRSGEVLSQSKT